MRTVWKYSIPVFEQTTATFTVPFDSYPVHVAASEGGAHVNVWFDVDSDANLVNREFEVFGTGHAIPEDSTYVGTAILSPLVLHVYER